MLNEKVGSTDQHYFYRLLADLRNRKKQASVESNPLEQQKVVMASM
jgi:hypothetical protein